MTNLNVTLASTLLELESDDQKRQSAFSTGVIGVDEGLPRDIWTTGRIVGVGSVGGGNGHNTETGIGIGEDPFPKDVHLNLITTHLLQSQSNKLPPAQKISTTNTELESEIINPSIFIIAPPNTSTISTIYTTLLTRIKQQQSQTNRNPKRNTSKRKQSPGKAENAKEKEATAEEITLNLLDQISILQYLNLTGLAESISEISSSLPTTTTTNTNISPSSLHPPKPKAILILIQDLPSTLSRTLSRSSTALVQTAALLTSILRSLRRLVKSRSDVLVIVELDIGLGSFRTEDSGSGGGEVLGSAFADGKGRVLRLGIGSSIAGGRDGVVSQANIKLARILENALDVIFVVHDGLMDDGYDGSGGYGYGLVDDEQRRLRDGVESAMKDSDKSSRRIVEIVKDRLGSGLGSWTVWK